MQLANQNWHIVDSEGDLSVPSTLEGVQPVYALPPSNFHYKEEKENEGTFYFNFDVVVMNL